MRFPGFVGPSYQSQSLIADNQICENWYVEVIESGYGKSRMALYPSPGSRLFTNLTGMEAVREHFFFGARTFAVGENLSAPSSQQLFEVFQDGTNVNRGTLGKVGSRPSFAVNSASQLMVASGGQLFLYDLKLNTLKEIDTTTGAAVQGAVSKIGFCKSFFVALLANSQNFQISGIEDGSAWDPLDVAEVSDFADNILAMIVDHSEIILAGPKQSLAYFNSGNPDFPFEPIPGAFVENGIVAPDSLTKLDNATFWIGGDERGSGIGFRLQGYTPLRISNHAVEHAWQSYPRMDDAIGYAFQDRGHTFWHVYFPTAKKSWRFDVATSMWHEPTFNDGTAHRSQCHSYSWGRHLVGDPFSGNIYEMSIAFADDNGQPLKRVRRAPHVSNDGEWLTHESLQLDIEVGLGAALPNVFGYGLDAYGNNYGGGAPNPLEDGQGNIRSPQVMLRWSDDGGKTWSNEHWADAGKVGEYKVRVIWRRLGRSRDRVYEVTVTDPVYWRIIDAYLKVSA